MHVHPASEKSEHPKPLSASTSGTGLRVRYAAQRSGRRDGRQCELVEIEFSEQAACAKIRWIIVKCSTPTGHVACWNSVERVSLHHV